MIFARSTFFFHHKLKKFLFPFTGIFIAAALFFPFSSFAEQTNFGVSLSSGKEPVELSSDSLEMNDKENIAIFSGDVSVIQGDRILRTSKLVVHYAKGSEKKQATSGGLGSTGVERMEASGKVYIKTANQIATGDKGTFDSKSNTMVLTGTRVILTDGNNVATGCKLTALMDTGKAFLQSCGGHKSRVSIIMNRGD